MPVVPPSGSDPHSPPTSLQPLCLVGPTAVGKSAVALALAEQTNGEIISVDSMQVYRGLDLGAAKPSVADRARIPHHLIDVVNLDEPFSAARFVELAQAAVANIQSRGRRPILCGGTGFYLKAWLEGLGEAPPSDPILRAQLEGTPLPELCRELEARDPATFQRIDRANARRVVRALEVIRLTGRPFSTQRAVWLRPDHPPPPSVVAIIGLLRQAADLRQRIDVRVETMFAAGLVLETKRLLGRGLDRNPIALQAIGYRQVVEHLQGHRTLPETIELVKRKTWQFAKRQATWFRNQLAVRSIEVNPEDAPETVAARVNRELD